MLTFRFTTPTGEYPGAFFRDYFVNDGYNRAIEAVETDASVAAEILEATYLGSDVDGVGVTWEIDIDNMAYSK